jgi:hypothetical protein
VKLLAAVVAVLVGLAVVVDVVARKAAESRIEDRALDAAGGAESAAAHIRSFPFVPRLLLTGSVPRVTVRLEEVTAGPLDLAAIDLELHGVEMDRDGMLAGRAELEDIDRGTLTLVVDPAAVARAVRLPVAVEGDAVRVRVRGRTVTARVDVSPNGSMVLRVPPLPAFTVPVVRTPGLLGCASTRAAIRDGAIVLSCDLDTVPPALRR